jgi:hypothetical protein
MKHKYLEEVKHGYGRVWSPYRQEGMGGFAKKNKKFYRKKLKKLKKIYKIPGGWVD